MKASIIKDGKKICGKCKKEKTVDQFVDKRAKTGRSSACLDCRFAIWVINTYGI